MISCLQHLGQEVNLKYMSFRSNLTVDIAVLSQDEILLIKRKNDPFKDTWALPGGFVDQDELIHTAACRELLEETNIDTKVSNLDLNFHDFYDQPKRDPRGRYISFTYVCQADKSVLNPKAKDDAKQVKWFNINQLPDLAFDHKIIIQSILTKLENLNP